MADTKISALTAATAAAAANEFAINEAGTSKKLTAALLQKFLGVIKAWLSSDHTNATTSMTKVTGLDVAVGVGTWVFEYYIIATSGALTNSLKFAVNHTGTVTDFMADLYYPSGGVTAATGAVDQELAAVTTGSVWAHQSTRAKNTTMGPQTGVDTINADILYRISGIMVVTVAGNIELYHGSEEATTTTVKTGSSLILTQMN